MVRWRFSKPEPGALDAVPELHRAISDAREALNEATALLDLGERARAIRAARRALEILKAVRV